MIIYDCNAKYMLTEPRVTKSHVLKDYVNIAKTNVLLNKWYLLLNIKMKYLSVLDNI